MNVKIPESVSSLQTGSETGAVPRWSAPECPFAIDYSPALIGRIRQQAVAGLNMLPHGGLEVGGLLFGRVFPNARTPQRIELAAERTVQCAHGSGPAFILSEDERSHIASQLGLARRDPELSGLSVLGFWVSHSRGELALSPDDRELYKLFPHPWQIVLILKPRLSETTRANFAFRSGGQVHEPNPAADFPAESSGGLFRITPPALDAPREEASAPEIAPVRSIPLATAVALMLLAFAAGGALTYWLPHAGTVARADDTGSSLQVRFFNAGPGVAVYWNAKAPEVKGTSRAELVVVDAAKTHEYPLSAADLKKGFYYCASLHDARMAAIRP